MLNATSLARLNDGVHPELVRRITQLDSLLDFDLEVVQGKRSFAIQNAYFAQGRLTLYTVNQLRASVSLAPITADDNTKVVTKAPAGYGWHEFGCAVDVAPLDPEQKIDWNVDHDNWKMILAKAPSCGLAEGAIWRTFPDNPHLYLQEIPASPSDAIRSTFQNGGIDAVWAMLTIQGVS